MNSILQELSYAAQISWQQFVLFFATKRSFMHFVLIAAVIVLIVLKKKSSRDKMLLAFVLTFAILYAFPPSAYIIIQCIGDIVYWRMFWLIPIPVVIACAVIRGTDQIHPEVIRESAFAAAAVFLAVAGMYLFSGVNFDPDSNVYGVPDHVIQICEAINEDAEEQNLEEFKVAPDSQYASWIRVYDPSIHTLYGRGGNGSVMHDNDQTAVRIYKTISNKSPDWAQLKNDLEEEQCAYVVGRPSRLNAEEAGMAGFRVVEETQSYIILYYDLGQESSG